MKTPERYAEWLEKIKKEVDYCATDEQAFEAELSNYELLYGIHQKMIEDITNCLMYATMYNQLNNTHRKFLSNYGLNGEAKLRNIYLKKKNEKIDAEMKQEKPVELDKLDNFLLD